MEKRKAFTLIELMGVLVIIGILTVILVPVINNTIKNNKQQLYDNQLEMIRLAARNLATDNTYILPEEDGEEIYITLGQLRAMGYAEGTIIDPLTNKNFPDSLIVMVIKNGKDYDYKIISDKGTLVSKLGINVAPPSKPYIKEGSISTYIITAKTETSITPENEDKKQMDYYINIEKENINLQGAAVDEKVKYKLDGNSGLYKLTIQGGEKKGYLYFKFNELKDYEGKEVDVSEANNKIENGVIEKNDRKIIVDNEPLKCNWSGENSTWTNNEVKVSLTGTKDKSDGFPKAPIKTPTIIKTYNQDGIELKTDNLSYDIEDEAGNVTTCSKNVNVYYDKKPPTKTVVNFHDYTLNTWTNQNVNRTFNSEDGGSGVDYYQWSRDCSTVGGKEESNSVSITWEGTDIACHRAVDKVGNVGEWSVKNIVKVDKTAPECKWNQNWTWTSSNVTVGVYGTDLGSGMSGQNSKSWTYYAANEEINTASLSYTIKDNAGNETNCSKSDVSVKHDTKAPRASCSWGAAQYNNQFGLYCNFSDASTVTARLGYCYNKNDSSLYWTCLYKSLDSRYNDYGWQTALNYYGFNIALKNDVPSMSLKIGFKDEAGNQTVPFNMQKTA